MPKLSNSELKALLSAEKTDALGGSQAAKLVTDREQANRYYMGDMTREMPALEGRSSAVSTDVADTIEGLMPTLMDIFCGGDDVVRFDPVGPEDVKAAEQETDYVNHVFMQKNPGFLVLYTMIKDALLSKTGIVKVWSEEEETETKETYYDQPEDMYALIVANPDIEVVEHTEHLATAGGIGNSVSVSGQIGSGLRQGGSALPEISGEEVGGQTLHDVTVVERKTYKCHKVAAVPPEEFGISRHARSIADCGYCYHEVEETEASLIDAGYDETQIKALPSYSSTDNSIEKLARDTVDETQSGYGDEGQNRANRIIIKTQHYVRMDYEDKGKPKLYLVETGGEDSEILKREGKEQIQEIERIPLAAMTPIIITHRFFGRSVADLVMDIQRIKTALLRGLLDSTYLSVNPRIEIAESHATETTLDDILTMRPGMPIRTKMPGGLVPMTIPFVGGEILPVMQFMDATREWRTGVSRQGQGVDGDALQNQVATIANQMFNAAQAKVKLIARIFAETGIRDLFSLLHAEIRENGDQAQTVRLRNNWVTVDPTDWKERNDMTINVGLGTGSKAEQLAHLQLIIGAQKEAIAAGLVSPKNLHASAQQLVRLAGYKDPDTYFTPPGKPADPQDPASAPIPQPPSPEMLKIQSDTQIKQQEMAMRGQELQVSAQIDERADQRKAQIESVQAQADITTQDRKTQAEMALAQQRFELEKQLKLMDFQLKQQMHAEEMQMKRELHQHAMAQNTFKLAAGAQAHEQKMTQQAEAPAQ